MARKKHNRGLFAGLPIYVLESEAYVNLPPLSKCFLYELAGQYNTKNNGYLSLTRGDLKARGFGSPNANTKAINLLVDSGLITRTRTGGIAKGRRVCNLYAINWQPINERLDKPLDVALPFKGSFQVWLRESGGRVAMIER